MIWADLPNAFLLLETFPSMSFKSGWQIRGNLFTQLLAVCHLSPERCTVLVNTVQINFSDAMANGVPLTSPKLHCEDDCL